uniref:Uncharacterized protein n=1 Tax=Rhinolophus ferrumequinum TaxID=59479 RepID=A0A671EP04_RHIFE
MHSLPHCLYPTPDGTFVTVDEPTWIHHHSKSIVSIRVHYWCCIFYGFRQMYNDMCPPLLYHTEYFHHPKNFLCSTYSSLSSPNSWQPVIFLLSP